MKNSDYNTSWYNTQANGDVYAGKVYYKYKGMDKMPDGTHINIKSGTLGIAGRAFQTGGWPNKKLTSITIPNSVVTIGNSAFWGCAGLTSINIPNSVVTIGDDAFMKCAGLTSINIPNSVTSIGDYAFDDCTSIENVTIGKNVSYIGSRAFDCEALNTINYNAINCEDFNENSNLKQFPTSSIKVINIGNTVERIPSYFLGHYITNIESITIPESVTSIGTKAFSSCTYLKTINFNAINCKDFASTYGAFPKYMPNLISVNLGYQVKRIPGNFINCKELTSITIPRSVTEIGEFAFWGCSNITSVNIKDLSQWCEIQFGAYPNLLAILR